MEKQSKVVLRNVKERKLIEVVIDILEKCEWGKIIKPSDTVLIKPNLCTEEVDKVAMANTDPALIRSVCEILVNRTKKIAIVESDGARYSADDAFQNTGLRPIVEELGIGWVNLSRDTHVEISHPIFAKYRTLMPKRVLEADVLINMPVIKTHALTVFTGCVKNLWGCVPRYDRIIMHKYLDELLSDLPGIFKPKINIMDGILCSEGRGPTNGTPRRMDLVLGSCDPVALDATCMRLIGLDPFTSRHLVLAHKKGFGNIAAKQICIDGDFDKYKVEFLPPVCDAAVRMMNYMTRYEWFTHKILFNDNIFKNVKRLVVMLRKLRLLNDKPKKPQKTYTV